MPGKTIMPRSLRRRRYRFNPLPPSMAGETQGAGYAQVEGFDIMLADDNPGFGFATILVTAL